MRTPDPADASLMTNLDMSYFVQEIALQCGHARRAWRELASAIDADDVARAYYHLQALLTAGSLISLILWPRTEQEELRRGRDLRHALAVRDDSPLADRNMRNDFVHFDERLSTFLSEPRSGLVRYYVDLNMYPDSPDELPPTGRLRHFDPAHLTVTFRDHRYQLRPVYDALMALSAQTRADWWQNVTPPEELSGEKPRITRTRQY